MVINAVGTIIISVSGGRARAYCGIVSVIVFMIVMSWLIVKVGVPINTTGTLTVLEITYRITMSMILMEMRIFLIRADPIWDIMFMIMVVMIIIVVGMLLVPVSVRMLMVGRLLITVIMFNYNGGYGH